MEFKVPLFLPSHLVSSLGQDKLELELMLKGSYEDTQTFFLDTAFTFSFHYMRGQDTELNGYLRVSLCSPNLPPPLASSMPFPTKARPLVLREHQWGLGTITQCQSFRVPPSEDLVLVE